MLGLLTPLAFFVSAPIATLRPIDEASADPSFLAFRNDLRRIVDRRDAAALLKVIDPKIDRGASEKLGVEEFNRIWQPQRRDSDIWPELKEVLRLGGQFENIDGRRTFVAPYTYAAFPHERFDHFDYACVIGTNVPVYAHPNERKFASRLSYALVRLKNPNAILDEKPQSKGYRVEIRTSKGSTGFVRQRDLRSPLDYRATFAKRNGRWCLTAWEFGD